MLDYPIKNYLHEYYNILDLKPVLRIHTTRAIVCDTEVLKRARIRSNSLPCGQGKNSGEKEIGRGCH
jgi:hypothetical protein